MKELLDGISVERLEFYANNEPPFGYTGSDIQTMARIALAVKQVQPIMVDLKDADADAVKEAFAKGMDRYSGAMLAIADREDNTALQNFRAAMEGIGHIRRTLDETFGGLHGTHCEPDVLVECKAICDAICEAYRTSAPVVPDENGLLPCPFCGSPAEHYPDGDMEGYSVMCGHKNGDCNSWVFGFSTPEEAEKSWNTRAAMLQGKAEQVCNVPSREHFISLCNQFWNWQEFDEINAGEEEPRLEWDGKEFTHRVTQALWRMYQAAAPQQDGDA